MRASAITKEMIGDGFGWETWSGKLDVRDFGADPKGLKDSTSALQAAIDTASHTPHPGFVFLPAGDYLISASLRIYEGISFGGMPQTGGRWNRGGTEHHSVRIIWAGDNASPAIFLAGTAVTSALAWELEGAYLHDFLLLPAAVASIAGGDTGFVITDGQDGITINGSQAGTYTNANRRPAFDIIMDRVSVRNFARNNFRFEGDVFDVRLNDCTSRASGDDGIETLNIVSVGLAHPSQLHLLNCYASSDVEDKWSIDFDNCDKSSIMGGIIAGNADGITLGNYCVVGDGSYIQGNELATNKIGIRLMGQGIIVQSFISGWATALKIGNAGAENINGWIYSGGIISNATIALHVTGGGPRRGIFIETNFDASITTNVQDDRSSADGIQELIFVSNEEVLANFNSDTTPDVFLKNRISVDGTAAITDFDNPYKGQILVVFLRSTTIEFIHGGTLRLKGDVNWTTGEGTDSITFIHRSGIWYEMSRNIMVTQTYTETNVTPDRAFNADTVDITELADIVGTLIVDLRAKGIVL